MARPARFPFLEHDGVLAFAHRGGAREAPENTMAAFAYAVGLGYRYLETDVYATRDGKLIAFHDDRLDRVTDRQGLVAALDWVELSQARIAGTHPIPLFADLLAAFPGTRISVDPKHDAAVAPLVAVLKDQQAALRVCVGAFSDRRLAAVRAAFEGRICTSLGPRGALKLKLAALGFPVPPFPEGCAQLPQTAFGLSLADASVVAASERQGLQLHIWTIDDTAAMHRLLDAGVHGLMTDRPKLLKEVLQTRGAWTAAP